MKKPKGYVIWDILVKEYVWPISNFSQYGQGVFIWESKEDADKWIKESLDPDEYEIKEVSI